MPPRLTAARIAAGFAVQRSGLGSAFVSAMYRLMAACNSTIEWKLPRRIRLRVSLKKNVSTRFSHEPGGGVKRKLQRGWRCGQA